MREGDPDLAALLLDLGRGGVELAPDPSRPGALLHRPSRLPPALLPRLIDAKPSVLAVLKGGPPALGSEQSEYAMTERLGVAEDLGMPTHPGSPAWLIAMGEAMRATSLENPEHRAL